MEDNKDSEVTGALESYKQKQLSATSNINITASISPTSSTTQCSARKSVFDPNNGCTFVETSRESIVKQENDAIECLRKDVSVGNPSTYSLYVNDKQEHKPESKDDVKVAESDNKKQTTLPSISIMKSDKQEQTVDTPKVKGPFFKLGMEGNFAAYVNQFATDPLALNRQQHMENKDRRRAVSNKFSVFNEFKLNGEIFGPKDVILNTLRCSVVNLENNIPASFMHPVWPIQRSTWVRAVHIATTPIEFSAALSFLEGLIKPVCFLPVWHDSLGHTELNRAIVESKADKKKREHKDEDEDVDYQDRVFGKYSTHNIVCL
jgi:nucleosome-remodeling factor subunit BPTF